MTERYVISTVDDLFVDLQVGEVVAVRGHLAAILFNVLEQPLGHGLMSNRPALAIDHTNWTTSYVVMRDESIARQIPYELRTMVEVLATVIDEDYTLEAISIRDFHTKHLMLL